jgi:hypothetical protein
MPLFDWGLFVVCRDPSTTSENGKNALGQEAFGSKAEETPVGESPAFRRPM